MCDFNLNVNFTTPLRIDHRITIEQPPAEAPRFKGVFTFAVNDFTVTGENMSASMVVGSYATLSVLWLDDNENPASVKSTSWSSSDPSTIPVTQAAGNPLIANVQALQAGTVTITATADPGDGSQITATIDIAATATPPAAGQATHGVISFTQYPSQIPPQRKK